MRDHFWLRWALVWMVGLAAGFYSAGALPAAAQAAVQLTEVGVDYYFGAELTVSAVVQSETEVRQALVFYRSRGQDTTLSVAAQVEEGQLLAAISLAERSLQAFSEVEYWFVLMLEDGSQFTSEKYSFFYEDNRYTWRELSGGPFTVHWYDIEAEAGLSGMAFGQSVLDTNQAALKRISNLLELTEVSPVQVYVYATSSELQSALSMAGLSMVAGHANSALDLMLISVAPGIESAGELQRQAPHELAHLLLHQKYGAGYDQIPAWLNEGFASIMEESPNPDYHQALKKASETGEIFSFSSLCSGFPVDVNSFYLSYAQSEWFVRYLRQTYGDSQLQLLLERYADGVDCERAPEMVYGQDLLTLQRRWTRSMRMDESLPLTPDGEMLKSLGPWLVALLVILLPVVFGLGRLAFSRAPRPGKN